MLDHRADLESDFSAIHHLQIDFDNNEYCGLSGRRFFQMAERLAAYPGVIQARVMGEQQEGRERGTPIEPTDGDEGLIGSHGFEGVKIIPLTREMVANGMGPLGLGGVVEYATSG